jgi:hypothetical protein
VAHLNNGKRVADMRKQDDLQPILGLMHLDKRHSCLEGFAPLWWLRIEKKRVSLYPSVNSLTHIAALSGANVKYKPALVKNGTRFCNQNL